MIEVEAPVSSKMAPCGKHGKVYNPVCPAGLTGLTCLFSGVPETCLFPGLLPPLLLLCQWTPHCRRLWLPLSSCVSVSEAVTKVASVVRRRLYAAVKVVGNWLIPWAKLSCKSRCSFPKRPLSAPRTKHVAISHWWMAACMAASFFPAALGCTPSSKRISGSGHPCRRPMVSYSI